MQIRILHAKLYILPAGKVWGVKNMVNQEGQEETMNLLSTVYIGCFMACSVHSLFSKFLSGSVEAALNCVPSL